VLRKPFKKMDGRERKAKIERLRKEGERAIEDKE
jgi:hypothetical protein